MNGPYIGRGPESTYATGLRRAIAIYFFHSVNCDETKDMGLAWVSLKTSVRSTLLSCGLRPMVFLRMLIARWRTGLCRGHTAKRIYTRVGLHSRNSLAVSNGAIRERGESIARGFD